MKMKRKQLLEEDKNDKKDKKISEDDRHPTSFNVTFGTFYVTFGTFNVNFGTVPLIIIALMFLHRTEDHINTCKMFYFDNVFR